MGLSLLSAADFGAEQGVPQAPHLLTSPEFKNVPIRRFNAKIKATKLNIYR